MLNDTEIIKADISHVFEIHELEVNNFDSGSKWTLKMFLESFNNPTFKCYILKYYHEVIGYVSFNDLGKSYDIIRLVVEKDYRRYGCATKLLRFLQNLADINEMDSILLDVSQNNTGAFALYARFGFKPEGMRKNYYKKGEDAILMRLDLT